MSREKWLADRPALTEFNEVVLDIWRFCCGWKPEALPVAFALYPADDLPLVVDQLILIREKIYEREKLENEARARLR